MSVKLRFKRMGRSNKAFFRLNAMDTRSPRDGRAIEELGYYDPRSKGDHSKQFVVNIERCRWWLDHGAIPSGTVSTMLKRSGLDHKNLKLPHPGKPKPVPVEAKKKEDKTAAAAPAAEAPK